MSQLPFIESLNIQTTIKFEQNKILINAAGQEQRIVPHQSPIREFNLSKKSLTPAEVTAIYALFQNSEGRKNTFLYTDKSDYQATRIPKILAAGVTTQGVVINSGGQYLLCKKYTCGANVHYRPIYSATNLTIYTSGGSVATGWTFNPGGTITGLTGSGHTATFNFDVLVRFNSDQLDSVIETKKVNPVYSLNVTLVEQRFTLPFWFVDTFNDDCAHLFAIDFLFKSTTTQSFNNQLKDLASGFNKIVQYQDDPITEITFGERTALSQIDLEYMQAFWLCAKGSGAFWDFEGADEVAVKAAFRDNNLTYTLTAPQPKKYSVAPLAARLFYEGISVDTGNNGFGGSVLTLCDCAIAQLPEPSYQEVLPSPSSWFPGSGINGSSQITFTLPLLSNGDNPQEILNNGGSVFLYLLIISSSGSVTDLIDFNVNGQTINTTNGKWIGSTLANDGTTTLVTVVATTNQLVNTPVVYFHWRVEVFY